MKRVYQATHYDCWNAAVASILEMPLEAMPDARFVLEEDRAVWDSVWNDFFTGLNLTVLCLDYRAMVASEVVPRLVGYGIANVNGWRGPAHAIVILDGEQIHDPCPGDEEYPRDRWNTVMFFQVLDPSKAIAAYAYRQRTATSIP